MQISIVDKQTETSCIIVRFGSLANSLFFRRLLHLRTLYSPFDLCVSYSLIGGAGGVCVCVCVCVCVPPLRSPTLSGLSVISSNPSQDEHLHVNSCHDT